MSGIVSTRRGFLFGNRRARPDVRYPPGVTAESIAACTGCGACAEVCPTSIIFMDAGRAAVDFSHGECIFCGKCAERCPERVFPPSPANRFSHAASIGDDCLALNFVDCQSCRDACPEQAIRFQPQRGGPFRPYLDQDACTGCGACLAVCPVGSVDFTQRIEDTSHA
jgi:ferredoxin-type protein NapF